MPKHKKTLNSIQSRRRRGKDVIKINKLVCVFNSNFGKCSNFNISNTNELNTERNMSTHRKRNKDLSTLTHFSKQKSISKSKSKSKSRKKIGFETSVPRLKLKSKNKKSSKLGSTTARSTKRTLRQSAIINSSNSNSFREKRLIIHKLRKAIDNQTIDMKRRPILSNKESSVKINTARNKFSGLKFKGKVKIKPIKGIKFTRKPSKRRKNRKANKDNKNQIEFKVNEMMIGSSSLLDDSTLQHKKTTSNSTVCLSRISNSGLNNNGKLNESSFLKVMDKLDEEDGKEKASPEKDSKEVVLKMNKLNLNLVKNNYNNIIMVEKQEEESSLCIQSMRKNLLENIKRNKVQKHGFYEDSQSPRDNGIFTERVQQFADPLHTLSRLLDPNLQASNPISTARVMASHQKSVERSLPKTKSFCRLPRRSKYKT
ncbi:unnamed protein product [Moneuplotes crassus]|uniref:Uncharacterized protein n=1 Tax=Euplotes crassus TaxID=5936 RepID=A0AAD1XAV5_EUPCR|nr:unnamed protein product [Moneuplotes crassus]